MYKDVYNSWLNSKKLNKLEEKELLEISDNEKEIEYRFSKELEFGTAGMRGLIGLGTNMMNVKSVARATQGLSNYIKTLSKKEIKRGVVISYDTRRQSFEFAYTAALNLASNGIKVYLYDTVHPVPMLSYAVRKLNTIAGIMITASHNPKEYNGYKVYGEDGAQMSPEMTKKVVSFIDKITDFLSDEILLDDEKEKYIKSVPLSVDKSYYKNLLKLRLAKKEIKAIGKDIKLIYTPVHGSGYVPVTTILNKIGIKATLVEEQIKEDTEFSTVKLPNPEFKETLELGIKLAQSKGADVVFGTDPDCDRLGVAIKDSNGEFIALSGNQVGILLLDYILNRLAENRKLTDNSFVVKSFVTTDMAKLICSDFNVELMEVPVGFRFIGEKIKLFDDTKKKKYVFGFEESCGYLYGTNARDKDAVVASMLFAEMVCFYTYHNIKVFDRLNELYKKYGYVLDVNVSTMYSGLNAMKEMNKVVDDLKEVKIESLGGIKIVEKRDYSKGISFTADGKEKKLDTALVNALFYSLDGGGFVCVRPSGTEPKLKVYYSVKGKDEKQAKTLQEKIKTDFEKLLSK